MINTLLSFFIYLVSIVITILFVVGTHEYAHFLAARCLGIKVLRFSIGFGKTLLRWRGRQGTEYVFSLIPLGGYVKMLDENEGPVAAEDLAFAFNRQPLYKKGLIVIAGPLMNIACALCLYWIIFMIGFSTIKPIIGEITPHSIAAESGLKSNQEIQRVDHELTPTWSNIMMRLLVHAGNGDTTTIQTDDLHSHQQHTYHVSLADWHLDQLNPDPLTSLGIIPFQPTIPLVIGVIATQSPAKQSALQIGDKVLAVNHQQITTWHTLITRIQAHPDTTLSFTIERAGKRLIFPIQTGHQYRFLFKKQGYLGIGPVYTLPAALQQHIQYKPLSAFVQAGKEVMNFTYFNLLLFGKLLSGKLSIHSLGGPIAIFENAGQALHYGALSFLNFLAFLSIAIGMLNILPIPGLDGGHLCIYLIEACLRRPISPQVLELIYRFGLIAILLLLIQAILNDLSRLYS